VEFRDAQAVVLRCQLPVSWCGSEADAGSAQQVRHVRAHGRQAFRLMLEIGLAAFEEREVELHVPVGNARRRVGPQELDEAHQVELRDGGQEDAIPRLGWVAIEDPAAAPANLRRRRTWEKRVLHPSATRRGARGGEERVDGPLGSPKSVVYFEYMW